MLQTNQIYLGDCLSVMQEIDDKSVDLILCDLPYGTTACKWDIIIPFDKLWQSYNRVIKDNGICCAAIAKRRLYDGQPFNPQFKTRFYPNAFNYVGILFKYDI